MDNVLMLIAGFVIGLLVGLIFTLLKFIFSPIMILIYSLFYRTNLSYKQRFALIFYKFRIVNLILYIIDTLALIWVSLMNKSPVNSNGIFISMIMSVIVIPFYIYLYIKSKNIIEKNNLLGSSSNSSLENKLNQIQKNQIIE